MESIHYHRPASVAEAVKLAAAHGDDEVARGRPVGAACGAARAAAPTGWIDLAGIAELRACAWTAMRVVIGAMTTHADVAASRDVRQRDSRAGATSRAASAIRQVRNRGTLGGSLANNDPAACYPAAVLGLGATIADRPARDRGRRVLQGPVRDRARSPARSSPRSAFPCRRAGRLRQVQATRLALRAGRRVRREDGAACGSR